MIIGLARYEIHGAILLKPRYWIGIQMPGDGKKVGVVRRPGRAYS
jgi:hypothetical protein